MTINEETKLALKQPTDQSKLPTSPYAVRIGLTSVISQRLHPTHSSVALLKDSSHLTL